MKVTIRVASEEDLQAIVEIFNQAVRTRTSTGYLSETTVEEQTLWFTEHPPKKYPILIAEQNRRIVGWASIDPYRKGRKAFEKTVEVSLFIRQGVYTKRIRKSAFNCHDADRKKIGIHDTVRYRIRQEYWK